MCDDNDNLSIKSNKIRSFLLFSRSFLLFHSFAVSAELKVIVFHGKVNQKTRNEDQCSVNGNEWDAHKQKQKNREREKGKNVIYTKLNSPWNCRRRFWEKMALFMARKWWKCELFLLLEKQKLEGVCEEFECSEVD